MDAFIFIILIAIIYAFCVMFVQKKFSSNSNNNNGSNNSQREPAKIADYNQQLPQRTS
jgi:phosphotransferase system  glucose/maltose/N-acetylglucosamine-specific IIC component